MDKGRRMAISEGRNRRFEAKVLAHAAAANNLARWICHRDADAGTA